MQLTRCPLPQPEIEQVFLTTVDPPEPGENCAQCRALALSSTVLLF
jgi:hypothetical protein